MKFARLIKLFRKLLVHQAKAEFKQNCSMDGCIDNVTVDMIKALYAAYHGIDSVEAINSSDLVTEWACSVLGQIQRGLAE